MSLAVSSTPRSTYRSSRSSASVRCRRKFLRYFPGGFGDEKFFDWERGYKVHAHEQWEQSLGRSTFRELIKSGDFADAAARAVRIESRTNLLFSFEKMALRDAVKTAAGAKLFATGLYEFLWGAAGDRQRFERWIEAIDQLPRRQTRVLTWPLVTVFGFIAQPDRHIFLKPNVTRRAAQAYEYEGLRYVSRPNWDTYASLHDFAETIRHDTRDLRPRDMIDLQSFMWVMGSDEYPD
jgi:hypothetical protein